MRLLRSFAGSLSTIPDVHFLTESPGDIAGERGLRRRGQVGKQPDHPHRPPCLLTVELEETAGAALPGQVLQLLDALAKSEATATFFVTGAAAVRWSALVRGLRECGHEVACHGYFDRSVTEMGFLEFREDLKKARKTLEDLTGQPVRGYRAPQLSLRTQTLWVLETLADEGFRYDASVHPGWPLRFGVSGWPEDPVVVRTAAGCILELPCLPRPITSRARLSWWQKQGSPAVLVLRGPDLCGPALAGRKGLERVTRLLMDCRITSVESSMGGLEERVQGRTKIELRPWGVSERGSEQFGTPRPGGTWKGRFTRWFALEENRY